MWTHIVLVYVSVGLQVGLIARVSSRFLMGGHDVPPSAIVSRRQRSAELFARFLRNDQVFVFDNGMASPTVRR